MKTIKRCSIVFEDVSSSHHPKLIPLCS